MSKEKNLFWSLVAVRMSAAICVIGWAWIIFHWPYANEIFTVGAVAIIVSYTVRTSLKSRKGLTDWVKLCFVLTMFVRAIISLNHLPINTLVWYGVSGVLLLSILYLFIADSESMIPKPKNNLMSRTLYSSAGFFIIIGVMFKVMHWPGAGPILSVGALTLVLWLVIEPFLTVNNISLLEEDETLLDANIHNYEEETVVFGTTRKSKYKGLFALAGIIMATGIVMNLFDCSGSALVVLSGFIVGGIYLALTIRN